MVEFDVSMFAFVREGIRYTRHKTSLCPAAVTGIYRHNPGHKKRGLREWLEKAIQNHPPKWRLLFFPWLYPTSSRCSSFVALKFSMLHIPLHGTHHAISCPLPRTSSPTHGWESVLRWHWGFRHGESPHFTMFGQWSLISLFLLHCCCGEGCVFFAARKWAQQPSRLINMEGLSQRPHKPVQSKHQCSNALLEGIWWMEWIRWSEHVPWAAHQGVTIWKINNDGTQTSHWIGIKTQWTSMKLDIYPKPSKSWGMFGSNKALLLSNAIHHSCRTYKDFYTWLEGAWTKSTGEYHPQTELLRPTNDCPPETQGPRPLLEFSRSYIYMCVCRVCMIMIPFVENNRTHICNYPCWSQLLFFWGGVSIEDLQTALQSLRLALVLSCISFGMLKSLRRASTLKQQTLKPSNPQIYKSWSPERQNCLRVAGCSFILW